MISFIIISITVFALLFWYLADRRLGVRRGRRFVAARLALAAFMLVQIYFLAATIFSRVGSLPEPGTGLTIFGFVWYLAVLPFVVAPVVTYWLGEDLWLLIRKLSHRPQASKSVDDGSAKLTRRELLGLGLAAAPPLLAVTGTGVAAYEVTGYRTEETSVPIVGLPPELEGLRIVHFSDTHVGRFTHGETLDRMVDTINGMDADVIAITGDLINHSLADLPEAIRMVQRLKSRHGVYICEGNHDLFEGRSAFEQGLLDAGLKLLLNESTMIEVLGRRIELLGLCWGTPGGGRGAAIEENMAALAKSRQPDADLSVLLAHHPHAFDLAAEAGIQLTLAGHTHGGQLMLLPGLGIGNLMFRYVTGIYRAGASALVVSNGAGNWMPLRINAPAEIVALTLTPG